MTRPLLPLRPAQADAADPEANAWVSASAGTGKTQVLTARVLRLLLAGAAPERILCLTFTKAAAAEMQERIFARLTRWVRASDDELDADLRALGVEETPSPAQASPESPLPQAGEGDDPASLPTPLPPAGEGESPPLPAPLPPAGEATRAPARAGEGVEPNPAPSGAPLPLRTRARQLFARVVDARGGLAVQTFHSFAQSLLAGFPVEAGIAPGFAVLDDRTGVELRGRVLAEAIADSGFAEDIAALAVRLGEQKLHGVVQSLLRRRDGLRALGHPLGHPALLRRRLGLPAGGDRDTVLADALAAFDCKALAAFGIACGGWGTPTGLGYADTIAAWLALAPAQRFGSFATVRDVFFIKSGAPRKLSDKLIAQRPGLDSTAGRLRDAIAAIAELDAKFALVEIAARHLRVGHALEAGYRVHKARAGLLDFDDMIARAATMLGEPGMGEWVRFKLDERIDHILIDEGQDTNAAQWQIAESIAREFYAGFGARDDVSHRTLFAVGDYKQSIFSFQGSDPRVFNTYRDHFRGLAEDAEQPFRDVPLAESFRSGGAILDAVDRVIGDLGFEALGLEQPPEPHRVGRTDDPAARVVLWPPLLPDTGDTDAGAAEAEWLPGQVQRLAARLARQVREWLDDPAMRLANGRRVRPEDILVLVRARGEFVGALVANLHAQAVPVAGVDRLRLTAPIAVQDCLSLIRFALQPDDDLTLAELMTSPFLGWDQDRLFEAAYHRERGQTLWRRLRAMDGAGETVAWLNAVLAHADLRPPHEFLETILSGPLGGRARLLARLGEEARDQVEALLAQALAFETGHAPSLQGFLAWVEADDFDLKRDPDAPNDAVRIMTVHGAKGLQAPIVVLADAARSPGGNAPDHVVLPWAETGEDIPVFFGGKDGRIGAVADQLAADELAATEEHWRLLYVAMTRAEDMLFIGGALGPRDAAKIAKGEPLGSWHEAAKAALTGLGAAAADDPLWGETLTYARGVEQAASEPDAATARDPVVIPDWARTAPAAEPAPPRPLSPSQLAADDVAAPPPSQAMLDAARRGSLLHKLFERLPDVTGDRAAAARNWLARQAPDLGEAERDALAARALAVIEHPDFADLFGPDALAEAPIAATVGPIVIAGKVDRLLIQPDRILVIDFKTGLHVPATAAGVAPYHLKQMAAYAAALARIFPGRTIGAALLYTEQARLIELPAGVLAANAPAGD